MGSICNERSSSVTFSASVIELHSRNHGHSLPSYLEAEFQIPAQSDTSIRSHLKKNKNMQRQNSNSENRRHLTSRAVCLAHGNINALPENVISSSSPSNEQGSRILVEIIFTSTTFVWPSLRIWILALVPGHPAKART